MIPSSIYVPNLVLSLRVRDIAGAIVECGTWKGGMIAGVARLHGDGCAYFLYDSFAGLPDAQPIDGEAAIAWQHDKESPTYYDNCTASEEDALEAMSLAGIDRPKITKGFFEDTLKTTDFPDGIRLLRLDADWYESTMQILEALFPQVNPGGLIIVDDYYAWDGCTKAVHEYLSKHDRSEKIRESNGVCFIIKR